MVNIHSRYTRPSLNGHKVLYKGRRYWVFEIDSKHPFEIFDEGEFVVYDCLVGYAVTNGCTGEDGVIRGCVENGNYGIDVEGRDLKEFIKDTVATCERIEREEMRSIKQEERPFFNGRRIQLLRGRSINPSKYNLRLFDKKYGIEVGAAKAQEHGKWSGIVLVGTTEISVSGKNLTEFVKVVAKTINETKPL